MSRTGPVGGNRSQQTIACDYLNVTKGATVYNLDLHTINNKSIQQIFRDTDEYKKIKDEIEQIKRDINLIRRNAGPVGFQAGRAVEITVLFEDIDLSLVDIDMFQNALISALSKASGKGEENIVIINVEENDHSTLSTVEVRFTGKDGEKESQDFVILLNSGVVPAFNELKKFSSDEFVYELSFEVAPIRSTNAKLDSTNKKLSAPELNFQKSSAMVLDTFKLKSDATSGALFIQKYDENIGEYVGGTIVTD